MATGLGETGEERAYYSLNARAWPLFAPFYDFVTFPFRRVRRQVAALARLGAHSRVLDVATGTGEQARAFAENAGTVIGIDLSEAMLRVARAKPAHANLTLQQGDATGLPFEDASFDVSSISFALHEMPRSIRERVAAEMARVTVPEGTILIVDYAPPRRPVEKAISCIVKLFEGHRYADFIRSDIHELLRPAGIDVRNEHVCLFGTVRIVVGTRAGAPLA